MSEAFLMLSKGVHLIRRLYFVDFYLMLEFVDVQAEKIDVRKVKEKPIYVLMIQAFINHRMYKVPTYISLWNVESRLMIF